MFLGSCHDCISTLKILLIITSLNVLTSFRVNLERIKNANSINVMSFFFLAASLHQSDASWDEWWTYDGISGKWRTRRTSSSAAACHDTEWR